MLHPGVFPADHDHAGVEQVDGIAKRLPEYVSLVDDQADGELVSFEGGPEDVVVPVTAQAGRLEMDGRFALLQDLRQVFEQSGPRHFRFQAPPLAFFQHVFSFQQVPDQFGTGGDADLYFGGKFRDGEGHCCFCQVPEEVFQLFQLASFRVRPGAFRRKM
ncbi:MAG: hypothetical protein ICV83_23200 [Cytophagales bacterium]|nr:hypothetical protein [Cytophagales bacterium]